MKKLFIVVLLFGVVGTSRADVTSKVVELRITKGDVNDVTDVKHRKTKAPMFVDRHFVCSAGFIDDHGDIITAKHCTEGSDTITVITSDNNEYRATLVSSSSVQDLALIHIDKLNTPYFVFASSVSQGEEISTLGSPLALTGTQSWGKVAKLDGDLIFMDESVLPGNSGGVVFNKDEQLVGCAVSIAIVGFGVTHLAQAQSLDSVVFFIRKNQKLLDEYSSPLLRASEIK